jgi:hypothetical protein
MRYRLRTMLITLTALGIGGGRGIAVEQWRETNRLQALERELVQRTTLIKTDLLMQRLETFMSLRDRLESLKAELQDRLPVPKDYGPDDPVPGDDDYEFPPEYPVYYD